MKEIFDIIILTHVPSSYKVNLYNEMAKTKKIFVVFISINSTGRTSDFINSEFNFEYKILNNKGYEERNRFSSIIKLFSIFISKNFSYLIVNGWDMLEFWAAIFFPLKSQKGVALESTIFETKLSLFHKLIKNVFLSQLDFALPSGVPHAEILKKLGFNKPYKIVVGVGIPNIFINGGKVKSEIADNKFLFIGRLVKEKNLRFLISCFNELPSFKLHIVGSGPLENNLIKSAGSNIQFTPHVSNDKLIELFDDVKCLILPSISETWGLVVEEALYFKKPVLISSQVGCVEDLVEKYSVGLVFKSNSKESFFDEFHKVNDIEYYRTLINNCNNFDLKNIYNNQIDAYNLEWIREGNYDN